MRSISQALAVAVASCVLMGGAQGRDAEPRRPPTKAEVAHARKMVRALDDYDAQLARRQRQLEAEQRRFRRMGH